MKNAIIIHGIDEIKEEFIKNKNSPSNSHWFPWLQWELVKNGILTQTPEMLNPYIDGMDYDKWADIFSKFKINDNSILIGHSAGAGFLLKYLSLNKDIKINHLILVAPWLDLEKQGGDFFKNFELDADLLKRCQKIDLFYSTDDEDYILNSVDKILNTYNNINVNIFSDMGHFCENDMNSKEFPELLNAILK